MPGIDRSLIKFQIPFGRLFLQNARKQRHSANR